MNGPSQYLSHSLSHSFSHSLSHFLSLSQFLSLILSLPLSLYYFLSLILSLVFSLSHSFLLILSIVFSFSCSLPVSAIFSETCSLSFAFIHFLSHYLFLSLLLFYISHVISLISIASCFSSLSLPHNPLSPILILSLTLSFRLIYQLPWHHLFHRTRSRRGDKLCMQCWLHWP